MKCSKCGNDFPEKDIHESHDVPCYLFEGNRKIRKSQADKFRRRWLCNNKEDGCHKKYEKALNEFLKTKAKEFANEYFSGVKKDGDTKTITTEGN